MLISEFTFSLKYFEYVDIDFLRRTFGSLNFISDDKKHTLTIKQSSCDIKEKMVEHCEIIGFFFIFQMFFTASIDEQAIKEFFSTNPFLGSFLGHLFYFYENLQENSSIFSELNIFLKTDILLKSIIVLDSKKIGSDFPIIIGHADSNVSKVIKIVFDFPNLLNDRHVAEEIFKFISGDYESSPQSENIKKLKTNMFLNQLFFRIFGFYNLNYLGFLFHRYLQFPYRTKQNCKYFSDNVKMLLNLCPFRLLELIIDTEERLYIEMEKFLIDDRVYICLFSIVSFLIYVLNNNVLVSPFINDQVIRGSFGRDVAGIIFEYMQLTKDEIEKLTEIKDMYFRFLKYSFSKYKTRDLLKKVELFFTSQDLTARCIYTILSPYAAELLKCLEDAEVNPYLPPLALPPPAAPLAPLTSPPPTGLHEDQKTAPPTVPWASNLFIIISSVISAITMFMYLFSISQIDYICLHIVAFMPVILLLFIYFKVNNLQPAQTNQAFFASDSGAYFKLSNKILAFALFSAEAFYIAECSCFLLCNNIDMYIEITLIALFSVSILISSISAYWNNKCYNEYQLTLLNRSKTF